MKFVNQNESAYASLVAYSSEGYFIAWCDRLGFFCCESDMGFSCTSELGVIKHAFVTWYNSCSSEDIRIIAATAQLRAMLKEICVYIDE